MVITESSRGFEVVFEYRPSIVKELKELAGVRFQGKERGWFIPMTGKRKLPDGSTEEVYNRPAVERFKKKYISVHPDAVGAEQIFTIEELPDLDIDLPMMKITPYPYQKQGIAAGIKFKSFINGDEPGTGKTVQSIGTALALEAKGINPFPCLVICPSTIKENWRREIEVKFSHKKAVILSDKNRSNWHSLVRMGMGDFIIVNYESLFSHFVVGTTNKKGTKPSLKDMLFDPRKDLFKSVIIDEIHRTKDMTARSTRVAKGLTDGKQIVMGLTGTPVVNKPKDLISQLSIINQLHNFGGYKFFMDRYCQGGTGSANLAELNGKLRNICFFRREKKDVLKDLPEKTREIFTCDITTREEYNLAKSDLGKFLKDSGYSDKEVKKSLNAEIMVKIGVLKSISARGKLPEAIEHIQEIVDAGEKIVVFIHQKFMANEIMKAFPGSVCIRGTEVDEVTGKEKQQSVMARQAAKDAFQCCARCKVNQDDHDSVKDHDYVPNNVNVCVVSIKAGGVGITLTAASRLMFLELPWHPADVDQCEARIERIGQKNAMQMSYFLGKDTIDEKIYQIIEAKREMSDAVTGSTTTTETLITDITRSLFNQR